MAFPPGGWESSVLPTPYPLPRTNSLRRGRHSGAGGGEHSIHLISKGLRPFGTPLQQARTERALTGVCARAKSRAARLARQEPLCCRKTAVLAASKKLVSNPLRHRFAMTPSRLPARVLVPGGHRLGPTGAGAETGAERCPPGTCAPIGEARGVRRGAGLPT